MLRFGRRALPPAVLALDLEPGERRLAWALMIDGGAAVATDRRLRHTGGRPVDWPDVERVSWLSPLLTVRGIAVVEGTGERLDLELADPGELPAVVRTAVTASIGWSAHYRLSPGGGVRLVGRRRPGRDLLDWQLVFDQGSDPDDPALATQADQLLVDARRTIG